MADKEKRHVRQWKIDKVEAITLTQVSYYDNTWPNNVVPCANFMLLGQRYRKYVRNNKSNYEKIW